MNPEPEPYWREVGPPAFQVDLRELVPPDAEQVWTVRFLMELPWSIRVDGASFLISESARPWQGWSPAALGALAGMPPLPEGVRPTHAIEIKQACVRSGVPLEAVSETFPDWEAHTTAGGERVTPSGRNWKSVIRVSMFEAADEVLDELERNHLEWLSRRFDYALEIANEYLVVLAAMNDEWHLSSVSRGDLPPELPFSTRLDPGTGEPFEGSGSLDIHTWFRGDLDPVRPVEETQHAAAIVREYRRGNLPWFNWIELYQAAEHYLGSGRYVQSVIAATTGIEVLINTIFRVAEALGVWDAKESRRAIAAPFRQQLDHHLAKLLSEKMDMGDADAPAGRWHQCCYLLRNDVVHDGRKPTPAEGLDAKLATGEFARWIGAAMIDDTRLAGVRQFLQARPTR
jgi:hypothetical protein